METTIKINTDAITSDFVVGIKKLFPHKMVEINIQLTNETDYILNNAEYSKELEERIAEYESKKNVLSVKASELL